MAGGLLNVGLSGLLATQRALTVTGHNISNANTEGYSRQRVDLTSRLPQLYGSSYVGNGVDVGAVSRIYDNFLIEQMRSSTATSANSNTNTENENHNDNQHAKPEAGEGTALQGLFNSMNQVSTD